MALQNFTSSRHMQTMVVVGGKAQDGQCSALQILGKQTKGLTWLMYLGVPQGP